MREIGRITYNEWLALCGQNPRTRSGIRYIVVATARGCLYTFIEWDGKGDDPTTKKKMTELQRKRYEAKYGEVA